MIILKVGGSAFSDKRTGKSFIKNVAKNLSEELPKGKKVMIVHGAGYIGHSIAARYKLSRLDGNQHQWSVLRYAVETTSNQIAKALIDGGRNPIVMSAQQLFKIKDGKVKLRGLDLVKGFTDKGFIPIIHGDLLLDDSKGLSMLSGDDMARMLANHLNAKKLIFCSDVDGIFDSSGNTITRIRRRNLHEIGINNKEGVVDVSGGMKKKLEQIALTKPSIEVLVINLRKPGELGKAISGKSVGTQIY